MIADQLHLPYKFDLYVGKDINDLKKIQKKIIEKNNKINLIAFFITIGIMIASFVLTYISAFEAEWA